MDELIADRTNLIIEEIVDISYINLIEPIGPEEEIISNFELEKKYKNTSIMMNELNNLISTKLVIDAVNIEFQIE